MISYLHKRTYGVSLLEMLLALALLAVGLLLGFKQYFQYKRLKDINQIQQSVDQLLQAGGAYYYTICKNQETLNKVPLPINLDVLHSMGLLPNVKQIFNPWGTQFQVSIISMNVQSQPPAYSFPPYLIQVTTNFTGFTTVQMRQLTNLLGADGWGNSTQLTWTRLPSQVLKHMPQSVQSPGGWVPAISGTYNGGQPMSSNYEIMNADLAAFSKAEAKHAGGFTCPD